MLNLICLVFQEKIKFPTNRAILYKDALEILLNKWDEFKGIQRDEIYPKIDQNELFEDSGAVLKAIEAQHGLLVERARNIYSFSHLTFQEYFTASNFVTSFDQQDFQQLVRHITQRSWREVFFVLFTLHIIFL